MYGVWMMDPAMDIGAWVGLRGTPVAWYQDARVFASIADAENYIAAKGWENTTSVKPGRVTAYVAELGRRPIGARPKEVKS